MPGLLDFFTGGADPAQQQGLLAATAALLQAGGASRVPISTGQGIGAALGAYQQGTQAAQDRALQQRQADQAFQISDIKLQDAQSDLANQQLLRDRQRRIAEGVAKLGAQPPGAAPDAGQQAPAAPGAPFQQQAAASALGGAAPRVNQTDAYVQRLLTTAQVYASEGDIEGANKLYEQAVKLRPKYSTDFRAALGADGKLRNYVLGDDGSQVDTGLGVAPNVTEVDLGGSKQFVDKNSVAPGTVLRKTLSPDAAASNALGYANLALSRQRFAAEQAGGGADGTLPEATVQLMAQQYRAGDTSVMQNLGRGAQGAQNIIKLRNEIARQTTEAGQNGSDLASKNAEYFGTKAGQRTAGTRIANVEMASNEAQSLIPLARDASSAVARSSFLPFGKGQVVFNEQTNDPALRKFAAANNALVNVYSRAISPSGTPTVADKEHAREMISTAMDQRSYNAVLDQMQAEITAARAAPKAVRQAFNNEVTGRDGHSAATVPNPVAAPAQKFDMLPPAAQYDGKRMRADNGTTYVSRGGKWVKE